MVQLPPAEPDEGNAIETFARLSTTNSQLSNDPTYQQTNNYQQP